MEIRGLLFEVIRGDDKLRLKCLNHKTNECNVAPIESRVIFHDKSVEILSYSLINMTITFFKFLKPIFALQKQLKIWTDGEKKK